MSKFVHFPRLHFDYRRPIIKVQEAKERYRYCRISKGDAAMGEKDIAEKILEDYPDVFADIVNGFLFEGKEVIKPDELEDMPLRSAYRAEKKLHDMERDVAKRWRKNDFRIVADYFVQKRKTGSYIASEETMNHMQELLTLLSVMEHDDHFEQAYYKKAVKGGVRNMASVFDDYFKQGEERGKAQKEAEVNERVAVDMIRDKYPLEAIKKISKLPEATIRQLAKSLGVVVL